MANVQALFKLIDTYTTETEGAKPKAKAPDERNNVIEFKLPSRLKEMKEKYNVLIERYKKAEIYLDCYWLKGEELEKAIAEREEYIPEFKKLINEISRTGELIEKELGRSLTPEERMEGFSLNCEGLEK